MKQYPQQKAADKPQHGKMNKPNHQRTEVVGNNSNLGNNYQSLHDDFQYPAGSAKPKKHFRNGIKSAGFFFSPIFEPVKNQNHGHKLHHKTNTVQDKREIITVPPIYHETIS